MMRHDSVALAFCLLLAASSAFSQEKTAAPRDAGPVINTLAGTEVKVGTILKRLSEHLGVPVLSGRNVRSYTVAPSSDAALDVRATEALLSSVGISLVWEQTGSGQLVHAVAWRSFQEYLPQEPVTISGDDPLPERNALVTLVVKIEHAQASELFSVLRGLMGRDRSGSGDIQYLRSTNTIVIRDLARKLRYYKTVIRRLDTPAPRARLRVVVFEIAAAQHRALELPDAGRAITAADLQARLLASVDASVVTVADSELQVIGQHEAVVGAANIGLTRDGAKSALRTRWQEPGLKMTSITPLEPGRCQLALHIRPTRERRTASLVFVTPE